jgi:nitroreductase
MEFYDVVLSRKSVRSFSEKEIHEDILGKILEAGRLAPSFQNKQCWKFIVVKDSDTRKKLALKGGFLSKVNFFIKDAPVIVVACADPRKSGTVNKQDYYLVDTAIAFQQMMLTAWNNGIGSCWMAAFSEEKVREILGIPQSIRVVALSPFGYPKEKDGLYAKAVKTFAGSKKRFPKEKILSFDKWE